MVLTKICIGLRNKKNFDLPLHFLRNTYATSAQFETRPYKLHQLNEAPAPTVTLTSNDAVSMYRQMMLIRRLERSAGNLYKEKSVRGFCHLYSGQEAVAVGMKAAMREVDSIISAYRVHGWAYLMGVPAVAVLSELVGRSAGSQRGKGGSMHMYAKNFYGGNGIVGAQVPLGVGIALAAKYMKTGGVCFTLYGDGAANQGQVFEAYNMAKLLNIPCIFVCENNGYGMGTSAERSSASTNYYSRGDYVPGIWVDGMDVLSVREAARYAVAHCTEDKGPILLEMMTYRYSGHSMSDPGTSYRTREEVSEVRQTRDPITSFRELILNASLATPEKIKEIDDEVKKEIDSAVPKAKASEEIGPEELTTDIALNFLEPNIRNINPWTPLKHSRLAEQFIK
ncbi:probable pyruvate dehydrogenase E1 component subunit alpha, mitochondrial [Rhodnius prolixus]